MHDCQLRRVPDVGQQQDRGEHQRAEHREGLNARVGVEHDHRGEHRHRDHPELGERSAEGAVQEHGRNDPLPLFRACALRELSRRPRSPRARGGVAVRWLWPVRRGPGAADHAGRVVQAGQPRPRWTAR